MDFLSADSLPWLRGAQRRMRDALSAARRLPHSLLLLSAPGLGAEQLANWIGAMALCESRAGVARAARAPRACCCVPDSHPDWHVVRLEEDAQQIKVDQIRDLIESLSLSSYRGGYKVGIIEGAEALNANGANAFLKTLEEPTDKTLLVLIARPSHRLPATIASRCLRLHLRPPAQPQARRAGSRARRPGARHWEAALALAGGAPLLALELEAAGLDALEEEMQETLRQLSLRVDRRDAARGCAGSSPIPALRLTWLENWITRRVQA